MKSYYPFEYKVKSWNDVDEKYQICRGVTFGKDMSDAAKNIEDYYGPAIILYLNYASDCDDNIYEFEGAQESLLHNFKVFVKDDE